MKSQRISNFSQRVTKSIAESEKINGKRLQRLNTPFYNDVVRSWSKDKRKTTRKQSKGSKKPQSTLKVV